MSAFWFYTVLGVKLHLLVPSRQVFYYLRCIPRPESEFRVEGQVKLIHMASKFRRSPANSQSHTDLSRVLGQDFSVESSHGASQPSPRTGLLSRVLAWGFSVESSHGACLVGLGPQQEVSVPTTRSAGSYSRHCYMTFPSPRLSP